MSDGNVGVNVEAQWAAHSLRVAGLLSADEQATRAARRGANSSGSGVAVDEAAERRARRRSRSFIRARPESARPESGGSGSGSAASSAAGSAAARARTLPGKRHGGSAAADATSSLVLAATQKTDPAELLRVARSLVGHDNEAAEACFVRALELDPRHLKTLATFAIYCETISRDFGRAERLYQEAAFSGVPIHVTNYANFLRNVRQRPKEADRVLRAAQLSAESAAAAVADSDVKKTLAISLVELGAKPPPPLSPRQMLSRSGDVSPRIHAPPEAVQNLVGHHHRRRSTKHKHKSRTHRSASVADGSTSSGGGSSSSRQRRNRSSTQGSPRDNAVIERARKRTELTARRDELVASIADIDHKWGSKPKSEEVLHELMRLEFERGDIDEQLRALPIDSGPSSPRGSVSPSPRTSKSSPRK